jgi:uncharacterized protein
MNKKARPISNLPAEFSREPLLAREPAGLPWLFGGGQISGDLPDINVWLALAVEEHPHHACAKDYWESVQSTASSDRNLWFCRVTMLGLVRLLCQPKVVGNGALSLSAAYALYQSFRAVPGVGVLGDPATCEPRLEKMLAVNELPTRLWTDAYLAALAQASGARLVTFDGDFLRFGLTKCHILKPDSI